MAISIGEAVIKLGFDDSSVKKTLGKLGTTAKIGGKLIGAGIAAGRAGPVLIPIFGAASSLNAGSAATVCFYEISRQRLAKGLK